jgi:hypothetical protein
MIVNEPNSKSAVHELWTKDKLNVLHWLQQFQISLYKKGDKEWERSIFSKS